jgi:hypothetical protein
MTRPGRAPRRETHPLRKKIDRIYQTVRTSGKKIHRFANETALIFTGFRFTLTPHKRPPDGGARSS